MLCFRFNLSTSGWSDDANALPLLFQFVTVSSASDGAGGSGVTTSLQPLGPLTTSASLDNVALSQPPSGDVVAVSVIVVNALGSQAQVPAGVDIVLTQPSVADLFASFSVPGNATQDTSNGTASATNTTSALLQHATASLIAQFAALSNSSSSSSSSNTSSSGSGSGYASASARVDLAASAALVLQVTACASLACGSGVCTLDDNGVPYCSCGVAGASSCNATTSPSGGPSGSGSASSGNSGNALLCPSGNNEPCSGHGSCSWSRNQCTAVSVQCLPVCR